MALYDVAGGNTAYSTDLDQLVDALTGKNDVTITAFVPIAVPGAPTVAVNTTAGNLTGNYQYAVAFVTGYWQGPSGTGIIHVQGNTGGGTASAVVAPSAQQVNLSAIPIGPTGVVQRVLYRTGANGSAFYYLYTLDDNTSTTYADNTADSGLGAAMPTTNTTGTVANLWKLNVSGVATFNAGLTLPSGQTLTNNGSYAGSPLITSLTATNGLSASNPTSPGAASYSLVLNGTSLSNGASGLAVNLGNANTWTAPQTFSAGITGTGSTGALTAGTGILGTANTWTALQTLGSALATGPSGTSWNMNAPATFTPPGGATSGLYFGWNAEYGASAFINVFSSAAGFAFYAAAGSGAPYTLNRIFSINGTGSIERVSATNTAGNFGVATVVALAQEVLITGTTAQTILSFTPPAQGVYEIKVYFRVVTGTTTVTAAATYDDVTGPQTDDLLPATSEAVGSYRTIPATIDATTAAAITVQVTASVANQVYATAVLIGY